MFDKRDKYVLIFIIINIFFHKCSFQKLHFEKNYNHSFQRINVGEKIFLNEINHHKNIDKNNI